MLSNTLLILTLSMTLTITLSNAPMSLGLWIMMTTLIITITMSALTPSWFSLIMFLIYVGALLVMFAYFLSIQPNLQMKMLKMTITLLFTMLLLLPLSMYYTSPHHQETSNPTQIIELLLTINLQTLIFLALTLFLALVAVVKITKTYMGPLRPFKYVQTYP